MTGEIIATRNPSYAGWEPRTWGWGAEGPSGSFATIRQDLWARVDFSALRQILQTHGWPGLPGQLSNIMVGKEMRIFDNN